MCKNTLPYKNNKITDLSTQYLLSKLKNHLMEKFKNKKVIVAYSGGIDSLLLSILLSGITKTLCVFIKTPYISKWALNNAITNAKKYNLNLKVIETDRIIDNTPERCYLCKKMFFSLLNKVRDQYNYDVIVDGTNYDDLSENRPGLKAKNEFNISSPFVDIKIGKNDIIKISKKLNITIPPKETCLLTRFSFNKCISINDLRKIEELEDFLRNYIKGAIRIRDCNDVVVIEVSNDLDKIISIRDKIIKKFKDLGIKKIYLDLEPYSNK